MHIHLTLSPHVIKYLRHQFGTNEVKLDKDSFIAHYFYRIIQFSDKPVPSENANFLLSIPLRAGGNSAHIYDGRKGFPYVDEANQRIFNKLIENIMRRELYAKLLVRYELGQSKRNAGLVKSDVIRFQTKYGIEESEWSYDTIIKGFQRFKKSGKSLCQLVI